MPDETKPECAPNPLNEMLAAYRARNHPPCLADLLCVADRDITVRAFVMSWRAGDLTFEQMACGLIVELARRAEHASRLAPGAGAPTVEPHVVEGGGQ